MTKPCQRRTDADRLSRPSLNLTDTNALPYTGCYMTLVGFDDKKKHAKDDGTCKTIFTKECLAEIIAIANSSAQSVSGSYKGNNTYFSCSDLTKDVIVNETSKCWGQWTFSASTQFLPDSSLTANATNQDDRSCPSIDKSDPLARSQFHRFWFPDKGVDNFQSYDEALRNPLPLLVSTWLKEDLSEDSYMRKYGGGPADTRVICLPANVPTPGSRNLTEALNTGGTARVASLSGSMFMILLVGVVLIFLL